MSRLYRVASRKMEKSPYNPCTINKCEYQKIYPAKKPVSISFLFLKDYVLLLPIKVIEFLIKKYPFLSVVDTYGNILSQDNELMSKSLEELKKIAQQYQIEYENKSKFELIINITEEKIYLNRFVA